jgi:hypothetical protein
MAKKNTTPVVATPPAEKKKATPAKKVAEPAPVDASAPTRAKRTKASSIDDVIVLLKEGKVEKAITALEKLKKTILVKKERKPRAPTPFNLFVSQKMAELKNSGMTTNERMKECARLWKEQQAAKK